MAWRRQLKWSIPVPFDLDTRNFDAEVVALMARPDGQLEAE